MAQISLSEIFDDLCSRFIFNCPEEEFSSFERVFFLIEEAHWFYDDFYRERRPSLPVFSFKDFASQMFARSPFLLPFQHAVEDLYASFNEYKFKVPVMGCILLNPTQEKVVLVRGWKSKTWGFPRGKISKDEDELACAIREVWEECGADVSHFDAHPDRFIEIDDGGHRVKLFIVLNVPESTQFCPQTRKEISKVEWHTINELPISMKSSTNTSKSSYGSPNRYYMIVPFVRKLKAWIRKNPPARHSTGSPVAGCSLSPSTTPPPTPLPQSACFTNHKAASAASSRSGSLRSMSPDDQPCDPKPGDLAALVPIAPRPSPRNNTKSQKSSAPRHGAAPKKLFAHESDCHAEAHSDNAMAPIPFSSATYTSTARSTSGFSFRFNQEEILSCLS